MPQCSQGHDNPNSSRFCLQCGEQLAVPVSQGIHPGLVLGNRYRIVRQLGQGGFGRTYLAEDINRFGEPCVLKEFAPVVSQGAYAFQKAEELFEREAGVLYKLQHPQIPRFRELFRVNVLKGGTSGSCVNFVNLDGKAYLFLVQDYVEGQTYRDLLAARKQQGLRFSELEVNQLLLQLLPVLDYIHSVGVIHRDISPDNLMLRNSDNLPVLIDFGGVKQAAATVAFQYAQPGASTTPSVTLLGKVGYAPQEQMQMGLVFPHSDLYSLAVTVLVLLTGKEPQELIDEYTLGWNWRQEVNLNSTFGAVLDKMLLPTPSDRYQSAHEVLQALSGIAPVQSSKLSQRFTKVPSGGTLSPAQGLARATSGGTLSQTQGFGGGSGDSRAQAQATVAIGGNAARANYTPHLATAAIPASSGWSFTPGRILLILLLVLGASGVGWWAANFWLHSHQQAIPAKDQTSPPSQTPQPTPTAQYPPQELAQRQALFERTKALGIDQNFIFGSRGLVDQIFSSQHSDLQHPLTSAPADADLRLEWYKTADGLLDTLEKQLSEAARGQLGSYTTDSLHLNVAAIHKLHLGSKTLNELTDAQFFALFPEQRGQNFIHTPIGQVWQAIAADKVESMQSGTILEQVVFTPGTTSKSFSSILQPASGKAYIANLAKDQILKVNLRTNPKILLSIYSPSGQTKIFESSDRSSSGTLTEDGFSWSGQLTESGFYEFVVVSTASEPMEYQLSITAENPAPAPSTEPSPPYTATPSPSTDSSPSDTATPSPSVGL
ncbi:MAG: protein kinase [Chroococcidiopsidaceae cyanobacterium CP_BM_RX_35]|nr:protein kinase [Chroococcidiopsidaceae cyanobacterium CP_BM_RX_35]